jgi:hypothetical protein
MSVEKAFIALAVTVGISAFGIASAAANEIPDREDKGGAVVPCSLDGINPSYHRKIFGNTATAAAYGFVRSSDGTWHVRANCRR